MNPVEKQLLKNLKELGLNISKQAIVRVNVREYDAHIELGVLETDNDSSYFGRQAFASDIQIVLDKRNSKDGEFWGMKISYGSSGAITPEYTAGYWRTVHAAEILTNFDKVQKMILELLSLENEIKVK